MRRLHHIAFGLMLVSLSSCNAQLFDQADNRQEIKHPELEKVGSEKDPNENDFSANEPVQIGGGFLVCAKLDSIGTSVGCRIEDEDHRKLEIENLRSDDLLAYTPEQILVKLEFRLTSSDSFWHWASMEDITGKNIDTIRLKERFRADGGEEAKVSKILETHPSDQLSADFLTTDDIVMVRLQVVGPPPSPEEIERLDDDRALAGGYYWYHGATGQSCDQVCENRGGYLETVTTAWASSIEFCANLHQGMKPSIEIEGLGLIFDQIGLGCFTSFLTGTRIFQEVNMPVARGPAKSLVARRFCACEN